MDDHQKITLRREITTYLGGLPQEIQNNPDRALATVLISVGNFLGWIGPILEKELPPVCPELAEQAQSISGLAKQFRAVGLANWDKKPKKTPLDFDISAIKTQLVNLEGLLRASLEKKGGAK
jgi:hypothetical protein